LFGLWEIVLTIARKYSIREGEKQKPSPRTRLIHLPFIFRKENRKRRGRTPLNSLYRNPSRVKAIPDAAIDFDSLTLSLRLDILLIVLRDEF